MRIPVQRVSLILFCEDTSALMLNPFTFVYLALLIPLIFSNTINRLKVNVNSCAANLRKSFNDTQSFWEFDGCSVFGLFIFAF